MVTNAAAAPNEARGRLWLRRRRDTLRLRVERVGFGARLFLALAVALVLAGVVGDTLVSDRLGQFQVDTYARTQRADARAVADIIQTAKSPQAAFGRIQDLLDVAGDRPGTLETTLIGPDNFVRASNSHALSGRRETDPRIIAALHSGVSYAGRETDPAFDPSDFEFVTPVNAQNGAYALQTSYTHESFDGQLAGVRRVMLLIIACALLGAGALFYLLGGRGLLGSHRRALKRATRDGLTNLPNHRAFQSDFEHAAASAARRPDPFALALLDLDHFKLVNDRHGHLQGDSLLKRVSGILRDGRASDRAYRIGGDEFALLLPQTDVEGARTLARRLIRTLDDADVAASIGVATIRAGQSADELRAEADAALYEAKRHGGKRFVQFEDISDLVSITTPAKRQAVRGLVDDGLLRTVYQPIWDFGSQRLLGLEALTRPDPSYGLSGPAEAFDTADQIGLVHKLDELCVARALQIGPELPADALLFLNLAPKTLELDAEGNDWLRRAVELAGLEPARVVVEVTERIGARTIPVIKSLRRLREQGFKLALDDVGTGNAGLEMLRLLDAEYVKIDRSIVAAAATEPNARAVLMAMATFARQTGAFVIAEGIEDQETLEFLRDVEALDIRPGTIIQGGQGFGLGRPSTTLPVETGLALPIAA
jgi:diguanylate cyclase (GGDEF)-like protein